MTLTIPKGARESEALAFAQDQRGWLTRNLAAREAPVSVDFGSSVPVEGRLARIVSTSDRHGALAGDLIEVPDSAAKPGAYVEGLLKTLARDQLATKSDAYAEQLGREVRGMTLRDTRSRWGSCSANGRLMYSWRLIMAPPGVLDYVAAHEVAHLVEMNHSARYWAVVQRICPDFEVWRKWLRQHGAGLHRYRFRD